LTTWRHPAIDAILIPISRRLPPAESRIMPRKLLVYLVLAVFSIEAMGCAGKRAVVRGQSPDNRIDLARLRRRMRRDVEPVLDATWKVHKKVEPALEVTRDATRKGLAFTGWLALLGGLWWLDEASEWYVGSNGGSSALYPASGGKTREKSKNAQDEARRREHGE
jgi:hypothetical protein